MNLWGIMRGHTFLAAVGTVALASIGLVSAGASAPASAVPPVNPTPSCVADPSDNTQLLCTVSYWSTGTEQLFTVPAGITSIDVELIGGRGGDASGHLGGQGDRVTGELSVVPGEVIYVRVGGNGVWQNGGYNGGGNPGAASGGPQAGGGGATDLRMIPSSLPGTLESRLAVAGGGGGGAYYAGGGAAGEPGGSRANYTAAGGRPGTQSAGGAGGSELTYRDGVAGTWGYGGNGGDFLSPGASLGGGGGGGGYYGGGGGASNGIGGGGGGSSLVPSGGQRALSSLTATAKITYAVPVTSVSVAAPTSVPALESASIMATAETALPEHSADFTSQIESISMVTGEAGGVTCVAAICTGAKAGSYGMQASFGAGHSAQAFTLVFSWLTQTITFTGGVINEQQPTQLTATSSSGLPVSYMAVSGPCTLSGSTLTGTGFGTCSVTAFQAGNNPYAAASMQTAYFSVSPVTMDVSTDAAELTATAGVPFTFPVVLKDQHGVPLSPQPAIDYTFAPGCGFDANRIATRAGTCQVTATVGGSTAVTSTFTVEVTAGPLAALEVTATAPSVQQGGSLTFTVAGADAYGNAVDTSAVVLTSSVATDQISGLTVSFPHASPHVITARIGQVSTSVMVEVIPQAAAAGLSQTGGSAASESLVAGTALALLLGVALLLAARRRESRSGA